MQMHTRSDRKRRRRERKNDAEAIDGPGNANSKTAGDDGARNRNNMVLLPGLRSEDF